MGLLSSIFDGPNEIKGSRVRAWAENEKKNARNYKELTFEVVFVYLMAYLGHFFGPLPDKKQKEAFKDPVFGEYESKYGGDGTLFELGCYMFVFLSRWVIRNRKSKTGEFMNKFRHSFVKLFSDLTGWNNLDDRFLERVKGYNSLTNFDDFAGNDDLHQHLVELIVRTGNNRRPEIYDFSSPDDFLGQRNVIEVTYLRARLSNWENISFKDFTSILDELYPPS